VQAIPGPAGANDMQWIHGGGPPKQGNRLAGLHKTKGKH
jgi:hypothetical protein